MAKTPEYTKRATANYQAKYDLIQVRFPKGTRERIKKALTDKSTNDYIVGLVLADLEAHQEQPTQPTSDSLDDKSNPVHEIEDMQKLQEYLDQLKKDNQERKERKKMIDMAKIENALEK